MRKFLVCENSIEIKSAKPLNIRNHEDFKFEICKALARSAERTPLKEYEFDSEEEARKKFEELKEHIGYRFGHYALYTLDVDELYIESYMADEDGYWEYYSELEHVYAEPEYEKEVN